MSASLASGCERELAVEAGVVGARRRPGEQPVEQPDVFRRGDHVDLVAGLRPAEAVRAERAPVADDQRRPRPARDALALGDGALRVDDVGDDLVVAAAGQLQFDAVDRPVRAPARSGRGSAPSGAIVQPCTSSEASTTMKATLNIVAAVRQAGDDRQDGEQDRHRAAQADPGDERHLLAGEAERQQAEPDRDRPRDQHQERGERRCAGTATAGNS